MTTTDGLLAQTLREEAGPLVASLSRRFADFDLAEEAVQSAVAEALTSWRRDGPPERPAAWLYTAANRNAMDAMRRRDRQRALATRVDPPAEPTSGTDDRLALLFACCHPALAPEARLALTLRAVVGLTTPQIARAFLVNEATLAQRIVRAKRKIVSAGIALTVPPDDQLDERTRRRARGRLRDVQRGLRVLDRRHPGPRPRRRRRLAGRRRRDLAAARGRGLGPRRAADASSTPGAGPGSTSTAAWSCSATRTAPAGTRAGIAEGERLLERAAALKAPGRYQLQAAIAAVHATAPSWAETDWLQIVTLYEMLLGVDRSPVTRLNRAVAVAQLGPRQAEAALEDVEALAGPLAAYHLFHATRAELLTAVGRDDEATEANRTALTLTANDAERRLLTTRLHSRPLDDGS